MKEVKAYQCSYCKFYRKTKRIVKTHEENCFYNPKNRACASCNHNVLEVLDEEEGGACNYCDKKEIELDNKILCKNCPLWEQKELTK